MMKAIDVSGRRSNQHLPLQAKMYPSVETGKNDDAHNVNTFITETY